MSRRTGYSAFAEYDGVGSVALRVCGARSWPPSSSCPGLSRASTFLRRTRAWMAGTSPAMTSHIGSVRLHQRAVALVERAEGFVAGHGGEQLVEVPFALGFLGLLDLEQIHVVNHAAVDADLAVLGEDVVDRHGPHLRHHLLRVVGANGVDRLEIVHGRRIEPG